MAEFVYTGVILKRGLAFGDIENGFDHLACVALHVSLVNMVIQLPPRYFGTKIV